MIRGTALLLACAVAAAGCSSVAGPVGAVRLVYHAAGATGRHTGETLPGQTLGFVNRGNAALIDDLGEMRHPHPALKVIPDDLMADLLAGLADDGFDGMAEALDPDAALSRGIRGFVAAERDGRWRLVGKPVPPLQTNELRRRSDAFAAMAQRLILTFQDRTQFYVPGAGGRKLASAWADPPEEGGGRGEGRGVRAEGDAGRGTEGAR